jgi:hypothetical protein
MLTRLAAGTYVHLGWRRGGTLDSNLILDGRPFCVSKRTLAVMRKLAKLDKWIAETPQPTLEISIGGAGLSVRKTDFEREPFE